jgi:hypothetical protein
VGGQPSRQQDASGLGPTESESVSARLNPSRTIHTVGGNVHVNRIHLVSVRLNPSRTPTPAHLSLDGLRRRGAGADVFRAFSAVKSAFPMGCNLRRRNLSEKGSRKAALTSRVSFPSPVVTPVLSSVYIDARWAPFKLSREFQFTLWGATFASAGH